MRIARPALLLCAALCLAQTPRRMEPIQVGKRVALVIGNSRYQTSSLQNPGNDANAMAARLRDLGFDVILRENLSLRDMARAMDDFTSRVHTGDLAFFYYSGHGIQVQQENYLIPVDYQRGEESDVPYTTFAASRVRDRMEATGARLRILVLDACRDNPFHSTRSGAGGLAPMRSMSAEGTLIAYATAENSTAEDNVNERNGLYTKYLLEALGEPGVNLRELFYRVQQGVYLASNRKQHPYVNNGVIGDFYFRPAGGVTPPPKSVTVDPVIRQESAPATNIVWDPKGRWFVTSGLGRLTIWNEPDRKMMVTIPAGGKDFAISPDGRLLIAAGPTSQSLEAYCTDTWKVCWRRIDEPVEGPLALSSDGKLLAVRSSAQQVRIFDGTTGKLLVSIAPFRRELPYQPVLLFSQREPRMLFSVQGGALWRMDLASPGAGWTSISPGSDQTSSAAESPFDPGVLWRGGSGFLQLSPDQGRTWTNVFSGRSPNGIYEIKSIEPSHAVSDTVYFSTHDSGSPQGVIFKTTDRGRTWKRILVADGQMDAVRENPARAGELIAVSTGGIWISRDGGNSWTKF